jgi:hypothetical protein
MKLSGDAEGIAALKAIHHKEPESVKFLIQDARTTTDMATTFRDDAGIRWRLTFNPHTADIHVSRAPASGTPPPPASYRPPPKP